MKILLINNFLTNDGGAEVYTKRLGELLLENGHIVNYFGTDRQPYFIENIENIELFPPFVKYSSLSKKELYKAIRIFYYKKAAENIEKIIEKVKPDIAHCNCYVYGLTFSIFEKLYAKRIPTILTLHDSHFACPTSNLFLRNQEYCENILCINKNPFYCIMNRCSKNSFAKSCFVSLEYLYRKMQRIDEKVNSFICPSFAIKKLAIQAGYDEKKLFVIENFVDTNLSKQEAVYSNRGYFLYVGRFYKTKGIDILLKAMSLIDKRIELHLVGSGPEEEELKKLTMDLGLINVKFIGYKTGDDLAKEYRHCIASILPSNYFETFGLTVIESFCYGKSVIGSDAGGIPEIIKDGYNGFIFRKGDVVELSGKIEKMYQDVEIAVKLGINAKNSVKNVYSSEHFYEKIIELYTRTISKDQYL